MNGVEGIGLTVTEIPVEVAVEDVVHPLLDVIIQVTLSLLFKFVVENVGLFEPTLLPFTCHWYVGVVPPFVPFATNTIFEP